ncbi:MAG TPA: DUF5606 domain-containing protein [Flavitalea sp.]|nr:DUF5606 domain-containing protein [Flavitalea sp.]
MEYGKIIAVTGMPGLFELLTSKNDGAIVRSLEDNSTKFVSSRVHNFSHLESIEVFTVKDNVNLVDIFFAMDKEGGKTPDLKDAAGVKKYFEKVFPDLDFERVYSSDLKKMAKWYDVLKANNIEIKLTPRKEEEEAEEAEVINEAAEKTEKKTAAKSPETSSVTNEEPERKKANTKAAPEAIEDEKPKKAAVKKPTERKQPDAASGVEETKKTDKKAPVKKTAPKKK